MDDIRNRHCHGITTPIASAPL